MLRSPTAPRPCRQGVVQPDHLLLRVRYEVRVPNVISIDACPSSSFTANSETLRMTRWAAKVCLSPWVVMRLPIAAH